MIDPTGQTPEGTQVPVLTRGNPNLKPEVAYEWTYGAVYSPKWIKGLTLSTDYWHIDLRSIASFVDDAIHDRFRERLSRLGYS